MNGFQDKMRGYGAVVINATAPLGAVTDQVVSAVSDLLCGM